MTITTDGRLRELPMHFQRSNIPELNVRSPETIQAFLDAVAEFATALSPAFNPTVSPARVLTLTVWTALRTETLPAVSSPLIDLSSNETKNVVF